MTGDILFLAHRLPYPPDRGDRIRSYHLLKALRQIAPVHVGCFIESHEERGHVDELAQLAKSYCVVRRGKPLVLAGLEAVARHRPVSLTAFGSRQLADWVRSRLATGEVGAIYVFSGQMGQFVPSDWSGRLIADIVDVDSAKFEAYADERRFPAVWLHRREARLLSKVEADLVARADHSLLVSDAEADLLRSRVGENGRIRAMGNGIDSKYFDPALIQPSPSVAGPGQHLLFTGQMDYPPNIAAVTRMTQRIMPRIRQAFPQARFHVVGRAPAPSVKALDGVGGTTVHGAVADMRPYLAAADLVVAPLTIARGIQNKVLEAMAMARPVLASPEAATGIDAVDGTHFQVAATDDDFARLAQDLLGDSERRLRLGSQAREFVVEQQGWDSMLSDLPQLLGQSPGQGIRDAA